MTTNPEKVSDEHSNGNGKVDHIDDNDLERHISQESNLSHQSHIDVFTPEEQKKIIRRIDFRLVPVLGFMYCVSLMDRTNLGIAVVGGEHIDEQIPGKI